MSDPSTSLLAWIQPSIHLKVLILFPTISLESDYSFLSNISLVQGPWSTQSFINIAGQQWGRSQTLQTFSTFICKMYKGFCLFIIYKKYILLYLWKKCIFHIWRKTTSSTTWFRSQASSWPFCHIMIHPFGTKPLRTGPQGAHWDQVSPERVLGKFHLFRHCSGFLVPSIIMGEWEIPPSYSLLYIDMREGKSQCFSNTVTLLVITQINTQRLFVTQGRPFLRHRSLNSQSDFRVLTSDPKGNFKFEHPLSVPTWLFYVFLYFTTSCAWLGQKAFLPQQVL